jgi:hypothetical protein
MRQAIASNLKYQPNDMNYNSNIDPKLAGFDYNNPNMMGNQMRTMMMPNTVDNMQGGGLMNNYSNGITTEMINNNQRQTYGPITLSNGAIYTGELLNGMKDGYGQQVWQDGSKYDGQWLMDKANG